MPRNKEAVKNPVDLRSLARSQTVSAINTLGSIMRSVDCPPAARVSAAQVLLDRGWGKPTQPVGGDEDNPLKMISEIRHLFVEPDKS